MNPLHAFVLLVGKAATSKRVKISQQILLFFFHNPVQCLDETISPMHLSILHKKTISLHAFMIDHIIVAHGS